MEILNNKYKIIEQLKQGRLYSSYKAIDLQNNKRDVIINILNSKNIPEQFISFCIESCSSLGSLNKVGLIPVYEFGLVNTIDNKIVSNKNYYYASAFLKNSKKLCSIKFKNKEKILDVFVKLCQMLNYLDVQGCIYNSLNDDSIYYNEEEDIIVFKDMLSAELTKYEFNEEQENREIFNLCKKNNDEDTLSVQVYSLGIILLMLCLKSKKVEINSKNLEIIVKNIDGSYSNNLYLQKNIDEDIYNIIKNMIQLDKRNRYNNITDVILEINKVYNKNFKPYKKELLEKLNFNTRLVGRSEQVEKIVKLCESMNKYERIDKIVAVHGESGVGKTRFLKHLEYILNLKNFTVYSNLYTTKKSNALLYILKNIASNASEDLILKYGDILNIFIPNFTSKYNIEITENDLKNKDKVKVINEVIKFICEVTRDKPAIIIIDNLHYEDEQTLNFFIYSLNKYNKENNVLIIFSYCDGECKKNKKFIDFLNKIKANIQNGLKIRLSDFNENETDEMISNVLCKRYVSNAFTQIIYNNTHGNPLFIEEVLKNIFFRKYIYINDDSGKWYNKYELKHLKLPATMYDTVKDQIDEFDKISKDILTIMSIFNKAINKELILKMLNIDISILSDKLAQLIDMGVLCRKIEDRGFVYDFYNKFLKLYLYDDIDDDEKVEKHKMAYKVLEKYYFDGSLEYLEEIIYHLEKSNDKESLKYYCIKNAQRMLEVNNKKDAISNYFKILNSYKEHEFDEEILKILIEIGILYKEECDTEKALECFNKTSKIGAMKDFTKITVDSMILIVSILLNDKDFNEIEKYMLKIEKLLKDIEYENGNIAYMHIKAEMYMSMGEYDKSYDIGLKGMELCKDKYLDYRFKFCNMITAILIVKNKPQEALPILIENLELCTDKYPLAKVRIMNNIGLIYSDFYEEMDKAMEYYEMVYKIEVDNNIESCGVLGLVNIGFVQYSLDEYEEAYNTFMKAIENLRKKELKEAEKQKRFEHYCYMYLGSISYKFGKYSEAYRYYSLVKNYADGPDVDNRDKGQFYILAYNLHCLCGEKEKVKSFLNIAKKSSKNTGVSLTKLAKVCEIVYELEENAEKDIDKYLIILEEMIEDIVNKDNIILIVLNSVINFYLKKEYEKAILVLQLANEYELEIDFKRNNRTLRFLNHILLENPNIESLNLMLSDFKEQEENFLLWILLICIGDKFLESGQYNYAIIYYFEACGSIIDLILQMPKELRLGFFISNKMETAFIKFKGLLDYYKKEKQELNLNEYKLQLNNNQEMESLFKDVLNEEIIRGELLSISLKDVNANLYNLNIRSTSELFKNFTSDSMNNIKLILKYLSYITISNKAMVIVEDENGFNILESTSNVTKLPKDLNIINTVRDTKKEFILNENYMEYLELDNCKVSTSQIKGIMCVPIIMDSNLENNNRKCTMHYVDNIKGYIYLESDQILNKINNESLETCLNLSKVLGVLIEKYLSEVSSSLDKVTGSMTRKYLEKAITLQLDSCSECSSSFSILMFDVDFFKGVNDDFGHRTGDNILKEICKTAMLNIRESDICGRYGGEEFIIVLPETSSEEAFGISERVRTSVKERDLLSGRRDVTISIGIANYPEHATEYEDLIEKADQALYAAKNTGRNKSVIWDESYRGNLNSTNKITGIVSGNINKDIRIASTMLDIIEIVGENKNKDEIIYLCLGSIMKMIECKSASLFIINGTDVDNIYTRKPGEADWFTLKKYDKDLILDVIKEKKTNTTIEIEDLSKLEDNSLSTDFKSVIMTPIIQKGVVIGILYLCAYSSTKEFGIEDANILSMVGKIMIPRL